eukprot:1189564-Prorocentrum_minimum.AAC.10
MYAQKAGQAPFGKQGNEHSDGACVLEARSSLLVPGMFNLCILQALCGSGSCWILSILLRRTTINVAKAS